MARKSDKSKEVRPRASGGKQKYAKIEEAHGNTGILNILKMLEAGNVAIESRPPCNSDVNVTFEEEKRLRAAEEVCEKPVPKTSQAMPKKISKSGKAKKVEEPESDHDGDDEPMQDMDASDAEYDAESMDQEDEGDTDNDACSSTTQTYNSESDDILSSACGSDDEGWHASDRTMSCAA